MVIGFTGTRRGLTAAQSQELWYLLEKLQPTEAHHGAAYGADTQFAALVRKYGNVHIVAHPCSFELEVSQEALDCSGTVLKPKYPLKRNNNIVHRADVMIACPVAMTETKGGTWYTIKFARFHGRTVKKTNKFTWVRSHLFIIWPDGTVTEENKP